MQLRFTARGNFRPLQASLAGLNAQMNRSMAGMGAATVKAANPMEHLNKQIQGGKMGMNDYGRVIRNTSKYVRENNALMNASASVTRDAAGNARVAMEINRQAASNLATLGQRMHLTGQATAALGRNTIAMGKNMQWAGRQVMVGLTVPLGILAGIATRTAFEYDKQMTRIIKVNNEASDAAMRSEEEFNLVSDSLRRQTSELVDYGAAMGFASGETTKLIAEFSQMGYYGASLDQLTESATRLSRVSGTELETSMELTRLTAQAFGKELDELNGTFAKLNLIENNTALSLDEMANALPVVAGVANTMGIEIEEVSGLMAMMKENGISAKEGATALRTGLIQIVQEATDPAIEAFDRIGLSLTDMKDRMQAGTDEMEAGNVMIFFDELSEKLQEIEDMGEGSQAMLNDFTGAIGKLTGTRQAARFLTFLSEIKDRHEEGTVAHRAFIGAMTEAEEALKVYEFEQRQVDESAAGIAETLRAQLNVEMARLGENFLNVANAAMRFARNVMQWFNSLNDRAKNLTLGFLGVVAALGPLTMIMGIMANAVGQVITVTGKLATLMSKVLAPGYSFATMQQRAMEAAYYDSARAGNAENAMLLRNIALREGAAKAAAANAAATRSATAAKTGASGAGAGVGAFTVANAMPAMSGKASKNAVRKAGAKSILQGDSARVGKAGGAAMSGAIFMERIKKALMNIPAGIAKGSAGVVAVFSKGLKAVMARVTAGMAAASAGITGMAGKGGIAGKIGGAGMMAKGGAAKAGMAAGGIGKAAAFGAGAVGTGGILAIIAAIAAIPILADPQAFMASFSAAISGPMERIRGVWEMIQERVQRIIELFRQGGGEESGLGKIASIIGKIAGFLGGVILDAITGFLRFLEPIFTIFEAIFHVVEAIGLFMSGEWKEGAASLGEALKAVFRSIVEMFAGLLEFIADAVERIPGVGGKIADSLRGAADAARDWDLIQSSINTNLSQSDYLARDIADAQESVTEKLEEQNQENQKLVRADLVKEGLSERQILNHATITDEMKQQLLEAHYLEESAERLLEIEARRIQLARAKAQLDRFHAPLQKMMIEGQLDALAEEVGYIESGQQARDRATSAVRENAHEQQGLNDAFDDGADAVGGMNDELDGTNDKLKEAEQNAENFISALRGEVSAVMSDIASAVQRTLQDQSKALSEHFSKRTQAMRDAHSEEMDKLKEAWDVREERAKNAYERQKERIDAVADRRLDAIDREEERERKLEEERKRWFEQQKARIDYLNNQGRINIEMDEAVARGDLSGAAIMRLQLQADAEAYMIDSYEREAQKYSDAKQDERDAQRDAIKSQQEAEQKALEASRKRQEEKLANERATAEKRVEVAQAAAERQLDAEQKAAERAQEARERAVAAYLRDWQRTTPRTEAEFKSHMGKLQGFLTQNGVEFKKVTRNFMTDTRTIMTNAFNTAVERAQKKLADDRAWAAAGKSAAERAGRAYRREMDRQTNAAAKRIEDKYGKNHTKMPPVGVGKASGYNQPMTAHHTGGFIRAKGGQGIKADEQRALLQAGEYVVQRKAVQKLGVDYLEGINQAHKYHTGGYVDQSSGNIRENRMLGPLGGYMLGSMVNNKTAAAIANSGHEPHFHGQRTDRPRAAGDLGKSAGKQLGRWVERAAEAAAAAMGPGLGGDPNWRRGSGSGWPPRSWARISANTAAAQAFFNNRMDWPHGIGAGVHRGVAASDHSWGKALDFMVSRLGTMPNERQKKQGWDVANWHVNNPGRFGTKYVIWDKKINSGDSRGWRNYGRYGNNPGPTLGHYDHVHVSYLHDGGLVPSLRKGGKIKMDNTLANLHKGETVLTSRTTKAFEDSIKNAAGGGGGNTYNLEFHVHDANIDEAKLAKKVRFEIDKQERKHGRSRVIK